jgi:hypothetical protein
MAAFSTLLLFCCVFLFAAIGCGNDGPSVQRGITTDSPSPEAQASHVSATLETASETPAGEISAKVPAWVGGSKDEPFNVRGFLISRSAPPDNAEPLYRLALAALTRRREGDEADVLDQTIRK